MNEDNENGQASMQEKQQEEVVMELVLDHEVIKLWEGEAPYSEYSSGQIQPCLLPYPVAGSRGAVVICPGGGYVCKADHEGRAIAQMINEAGISAYVLAYRVYPCHYEAPLSDAKRAIRLVRSMGYEKVAIMGFSAGGHLTCCAATMYDNGDPKADDPVERYSSRPDEFIPCYSVISFVKDYRHEGSPEHLLDSEKNNEKLLRRFSPELNVTDDTPEAFFWHTSVDDGVDVQNSLDMATQLHIHGIPFELHVFPLGGHGLGLSDEEPGVLQWATLFKNWLLRKNYGVSQA